MFFYRVKFLICLLIGWSSGWSIKVLKIVNIKMIGLF